jgi:hypothetical protein
MPRPDDPQRSPTPAGTGTLAVPTSNGHGAHPEVNPLARRPLPGPSTRPALLVFGIIAVLFLLGFVLETVSSNQSKPVAAPHSVVTARGAVLRAVPARPLLRAIVGSGQPPSDLLNALAVPAGSTAVPASTTDRGVELYDRSIRIVVPASEQNVIAFFRAQLPSMHWKRLSQGPASAGSTSATSGAGGGYQILEQHPASDGHEWEVGITVSPTQFAPASSGAVPSSPSASAPGRDATAFTLRLFSQGDQD